MFEILGYIFAFIIVCYVVTTIVMGCVNMFKDGDDQWVSIKSSVSYWCNSFVGGWYVLPTIQVDVNCYLTITLSWICWQIDIYFYIDSEAQDCAEHKARMDITKKND